MKLSVITALVSLSAPLVQAAAVPAVADDAGPAVVPRFRPAYAYDDKRDESPARADIERLFRRKGGGGSGGRGGSSGSSGSSSGGRGGSSSSSSGSRGGSSSSGGGSSSSSGSRSGSSSSSSGSKGSSSSSSSKGSGSSSSSTGGRTTTGSGPAAQYGGGAYYGGGASVPYRSGQKSPSGIAPVALGAGVGAGLATYHFWPGVWYHPIYYYPYGASYHYYNHSSKRNETRNVGCGCDETVECGCDENTNSTFFNDVIGNGSYEGLNKTLVNVADVNGTTTILLNGTLPNGTTAAGGTDSPNAAGSMRALLEHAGWWPVAVMVAMMICTL